VLPASRDRAKGDEFLTFRVHSRRHGAPETRSTGLAPATGDVRAVSLWGDRRPDAALASCPLRDLYGVIDARIKQLEEQGAGQSPRQLRPSRRGIRQRDAPLKTAAREPPTRAYG
jgi:hypothetical protein